MSAHETICPRCRREDIAVEYDIEGENRAATMSGPQEYAEVLVLKITAADCRCWEVLPHSTTTEDDSFIDDIIEAAHSEPDDDDARWGI